MHRGAPTLPVHPSAQRRDGGPCGQAKKTGEYRQPCRARDEDTYLVIVVHEPESRGGLRIGGELRRGRKQVEAGCGKGVRGGEMRGGCDRAYGESQGLIYVARGTLYVRSWR